MPWTPRPPSRSGLESRSRRPEYKVAPHGNNGRAPYGKFTGSGLAARRSRTSRPSPAASSPAAALIGIDAGTKTLGLALSDVTRTIASPLTVLRRTKFKEDAAELLRIAAEHSIGGFVLGLPTNLDGTAGPARAGDARLRPQPQRADASCRSCLWDERLSTAAAERTLLEADASRKRRAEVIDKLAATIILQGALDRMRRRNGPISAPRH